MPGYARSFVRLLYLIIVVQFTIITVLLGALSNEYLSNSYMQAWISTHVPLVGVFLHGELDALLIGLAIGAIFLVIQRRTVEGNIEPTTTQPSNRPTTTPAPILSRSAQDPLGIGESSPDPAEPVKKRRSTRKQSIDTGSELDKTDF